MKQAAKLAEDFSVRPDVIVLSSYVRTAQTAEPLRQRFPDVPVEEWPVHEFTFLAPAHYAGTTQAERAPPARAYWQRCDPEFIDGEGAESFVQFMARVDEMLRCLREYDANRIAIFTHAYVMKAVLWRQEQPVARIDAGFMRGFRELHYRHAIANGSVMELEWTARAT